MRSFAEKHKPTQPRAHFGQSREVISILHLQRTIGNQLVPRLLQNKTEDIYEQEADRVADQGMGRIESPLKPTCSCGGGCPNCRKEQGHHRHLQTERIQENKLDETLDGALVRAQINGSTGAVSAPIFSTHPQTAGGRTPRTGGCRFVISYGNFRTIPCVGNDLCGAAIRYDVTGVAATGSNCPQNRFGLQLTERVTNDHGCTSLNVSPGAGCLVQPSGLVTGCQDTYGICELKTNIPAAGCTETITQQLFVGGTLAETHSIVVRLVKSGDTCSGTVNRT